MGVTAYVATNANGSQLVLKGTEGANNAFTITASGTSDASSTGFNSVGVLAYSTAATSTTITQQQGAGNAAYKLDGIARTSTSNTITNAAPGLSLKLTGTNVGNPTTITYSDPSSSITNTMTNLVAALNAMVTEMNTTCRPPRATCTMTRGRRLFRAPFRNWRAPRSWAMPPMANPKRWPIWACRPTGTGHSSWIRPNWPRSCRQTPAGLRPCSPRASTGSIRRSSNDLGVDDQHGYRLFGRFGDALHQFAGHVDHAKTKLSDQQEALRQRLITQYAASNAAVAASIPR
jgi:flagellar hook-associated protein 2